MDTSLSQPNVDLMENVRITGLNTKFSLPYLLVFRGIARCGRSPDRATVARSETGHSHRRLLRGYSLPTRIDVEMAFGVYITSEKGEEALLVNNAVGYLVFQVQQEAKAKIEVGDYNDLA